MSKYHFINKKMPITKRKFKHSTKFYRNARQYEAEMWGREASLGSLVNRDPISEERPIIPIATQQTLMDISPTSSKISGFLTNTTPGFISLQSDSSLSSTTDSEDQNYDEESVREKVRMWALEYQITHRAVDGLLQILNEINIKSIPKDSRSLLQTPRKINIVDISGGQYWHNGFDEIQQILCSYATKPTNVSLKFNIDGLPVSRSSRTEFWPILCLINEFPNHQPIIIGIYCGMTKPQNLYEYLYRFVDDLKKVIENGIPVNAQILPVKVAINCFICDTPARSFVKGTVNFNHYHGCAKCTTVGEWDKKGHHMSFPRIDAPRRTDALFRCQADADHHKEVSPLEKLPINMVDDFPIADSLHLLDLGIMKKCLVGWTHGSFNFRTKWSSRQIEEVSALLLSYNQYKPIEIHRAIRKLDCLKFWKGLEFRTFLLYIGVVILKDFLPAEAYNHFLLIFCVIRICSSKLYHQQIDLADVLLRDYIEQYKNLYGKDLITSNVHNLCHLIDDVKKFGPLPAISAYPFENRLNYIKRLLRNGNRPLAQIAKRITELFHSENQEKIYKNYPQLSKELKLLSKKKFIIQ